MLWLDLQSNIVQKKEEEIAILKKHAIRLLECGCSYVFIAILGMLRVLQAFNDVTDICEHVLDKAIVIRQVEADEVDETRAKVKKHRHSEHKKKIAHQKAQGNGAGEILTSDVVPSEHEHPEDVEELRIATLAAEAKRSPEDCMYFALGMDPQVWNILIDCALHKANRNQ